MHILRMEHGVADYDEWKKLFDSDPLGRQASGVTGYRVMRAADDPNHVLIDLEFNSAEEAAAMHEKLLELWGRIDTVSGAGARSVEVIEAGTY